ncbi:magnesium transporter CorA family protein [Bariatricus sp. HCP28S3_A7]|uniref:magnesium transporter CorA family protein n=1 Tax=Bariatricus sp. HCP28S3_A7 TaxID=3438894 RepID=UPI003F8A8864
MLDDQILQTEQNNETVKTEKSIGFEPIITDSHRAARVLEENGIVYEGDIELGNIGFCKIEAQQGCLTGSFCIPKLLDVQGSRYRILFFITSDKVVLVADDGFSKRLVSRIKRRKSTRYKTKEIFLFNFIAEFMNRDLEYLVQFEKKLMELEEAVHRDHTENFQSSIATIRRELLILRGYYDEIMDVGKALEENENHYFAKKHLKYFGTISDRAERLMNKTSHLLEYAGQVNDAYQAKVDAKQNSNMQFLTIISTVFFPLTLITGWYGMNFQNMPELESGYPGVILLSVIVVVACIIIFKIKKIF